MIEWNGYTECTLRRAGFTIDWTVSPAAEVCPAHRPSRPQPIGRPAWKLAIDHIVDVGHAIRRFGVGAEELGLPASAAGLLENLHDADHCAGVVASLGHQPDAPAVRLQFVFAPVLHVDRGSDRLRHLRALGVSARDARRAGQALSERLLGQSLGAVSGEHMPDFVPEHASQLALGLKLLVERRGDEDLSARQGERIDGLWIAQQMKLERIVETSLLSPGVVFLRAVGRKLPARARNRRVLRRFDQLAVQFGAAGL